MKAYIFLPKHNFVEMNWWKNCLIFLYNIVNKLKTQKMIQELPSCNRSFQARCGMHSAHLAIVEVDHLEENDFLKREINARRYESGKWKHFKVLLSTYYQSYKYIRITLPEFLNYKRLEESCGYFIPWQNLLFLLIMVVLRSQFDFIGNVCLNFKMVYG